MNAPIQPSLFRRNKLWEQADKQAGRNLQNALKQTQDLFAVESA